MTFKNIKTIFPYATLVVIIIGLVAYVWADTKEELKAKADNITVIQYMNRIDKQRTEDREFDREQRQIERNEKDKQDVINQKLLESVQFLMNEQKQRGSGS